MSDDPLAWETLERQVAYSCDGFDVVNEEVLLPDGERAEFDYVSESESVVVLPFVDRAQTERTGWCTTDGKNDDRNAGATDRGTADPEDREVVVIEEWRQAVGRINRGIPAGSREPRDPDLATAARRELTEETGYVADEVRKVVSLEPANGFADSVFHYFVALGCRPEADQRLDHDESIRVGTTTLASLRSAVASGTVRDGRTALAVLYHQLHGP